MARTPPRFIFLLLQYCVFTQFILLTALPPRAAVGGWAVGFEGGAEPLVFLGVFVLRLQL